VSAAPREASRGSLDLELVFEAGRGKVARRNWSAGRHRERVIKRIWASWLGFVS
jgi:hypothetical protein